MASYDEDDYWDDIPEDWQEGITKEYTWYEIAIAVLYTGWVIPLLLAFFICHKISTLYKKLRAML